MGDNTTIKQYLVALGWSVDQTSMRQFQSTLRWMQREVEQYTTHPITGIASLFAKTGLTVAGALAGIGVASVGLLKHVADSDLSMQMFARRMFMGVGAARDMKTSLEALGVSLEDVIWGPVELRERYGQLMRDQQKMGLGADWETQMRHIRDVEFQFTRLQMTFERGFLPYLAGSISKSLFGDSGDLEKNLQLLNDEFIKNLPVISDQVAHVIAPAMHEIWEEILKPMGQWLQDPRNLKGLIDDLKSVGQEVGEVASDFKALFDIFKSSPQDFKEIFKYGAGGAVVGGVLGGPIGAGVGAAAGAGLGTLSQYMEIVNPRKEELQRFAAMAAKTYGIDPKLYQGLIEWESAHTWDPTITSKAGAYGLSQFMPETGKRYLVPKASSSEDMDAAIRQLFGGAHYLADILKYQTHGDMDKALDIYSGHARNYAEHVHDQARLQPQSFSPQVTINLQGSHHSAEEMGNIVVRKIAELQRIQNQRTGVQFANGYA
ncbi:MAG TPA: lytic transglycosylase domain-containing protein [Candidatus Sulfotelmatobacter sp.]|nr:lytic transglycosylase domain-containing protein [Candidatus Sulfotelmatobacter sp.]